MKRKGNKGTAGQREALMDRHRKWGIEAMPLSSIIESVCCRKGCERTVFATTLTLPAGWKHIVIASGSLFDPANIMNADVDGILCPEHFKELLGHLKQSEPPEMVGHFVPGESRIPERFDFGVLKQSVRMNDRVKSDKEFFDFVGASLRRHLRGDWGEISEEDRRVNDDHLAHCGRLVSMYARGNGSDIIIVTEADRSATTILFLDESGAAPK